MHMNACIDIYRKHLIWVCNMLALLWLVEKAAPSLWKSLPWNLRGNFLPIVKIHFATD